MDRELKEKEKESRKKGNEKEGNNNGEPKGESDEVQEGKIYPNPSK